MHYFSCSGGTGADLTRKCAGTHCDELVFLYLVGPVGHVVDSGGSEM
jgi:hypothetical protein